jgi:DNA-directed RNA polymerase subunit RPC12/RpoP
MIEVQCKNCGRIFSAPESVAGKESRCPKCKSIVLVPKAADSKDSILDPDLFDIGKGSTIADSSVVQQPLQKSILDPKLFDTQRENMIDDSPAARQALSVKTMDDLMQLKAGRTEVEPLPVRKLPLFIDIFLFPLNPPGLIMIGILVGVPLFMEVLSSVIARLIPLFLPLFYLLYIICVVVSVIIVNPVIAFYRYWFIGECVRSSAEGQIRSPETLSYTPGPEVIWSFLRIFVCICIFSVPIFYYLAEQKEVERNFWSLLWFLLLFSRIVVSEIGRGGITFHLLLLFAAVFFPMTVLSVIMFDSLRGLNPILIIRSIFKTFVPYCGLIILLCVLAAPVLLMRKFFIDQVLGGGIYKFPPYIIGVLSLYLILVAAHLLGRFYWKYEEKLNWEV